MGCRHDRRFFRPRSYRPSRARCGCLRSSARLGGHRRVCRDYVEAAVVVDSARDPVASRRFDELVRVADIEIVAVTAEHATLARQAYRDFGRGSGSPARLNFGDCFAYALAAQRRETLLFKGEDFIHTELVAAELPGG